MRSVRPVISTVFLALVSRTIANSLPYERVEIPYSITPWLIYGTSQGNLDFSGYSYTSDDFTGGRSNVIFTIGPQTQNIRNGGNSVPVPLGAMVTNRAVQQKSTAGVNTAVTPTNVQSMDTGAQVESQTEHMDVSAHPTRVSDENSQTKVLPQQLFRVQPPYPVFHVDAFNAPLQRSFSGLPVIPNNFIPSYSYDPYAHLRENVHPYSVKFYNPVAPVIYRSPLEATYNNFGGIPLYEKPLANAKFESMDSTSNVATAVSTSEPEAEKTENFDSSAKSTGMEESTSTKMTEELVNATADQSNTNAENKNENLSATLADGKTNGTTEKNASEV